MGSKISAAVLFSSNDIVRRIRLVAGFNGFRDFLRGVSSWVWGQDTLVAEGFGFRSIWRDFRAGWSIFMEYSSGDLHSDNDAFESDKTDTEDCCLEDLGGFDWVFDWDFISVSSF